MHNAKLASICLHVFGSPPQAANITKKERDFSRPIVISLCGSLLLNTAHLEAIGSACRVGNLHLVDCAGGGQVKIERHRLAVSRCGGGPIVALPRLRLRWVDIVLMVHILDSAIRIATTTTSRVEVVGNTIREWPAILLACLLEWGIIHLIAQCEHREILGCRYTPSILATHWK